MLSLTVFLCCYALFVALPRFKTGFACVGAAILIVADEIPFHALWTEVHWNIVGLFLGTLILAELFIASRMPAVIAEKMVDRTRTVRGALLSLLFLSSVLSMAIENAAVVLILGPVACSLCDKLKISPLQPIIYLAMLSNIQGTATLIGDPPSMILGSYMNLSFLDFFIYQGKPGIFFVIQVGFLSGMAYLAYQLRDQKQSTKLIPVESIASWMPAVLLILLVIILACASPLDPNSHWLAGTTAMFLGLIGLIWNHFHTKLHEFSKLFRALDWDTTFFLVALFLLLAGLRMEGWISWTADYASVSLSHSPLMLFISITLLSVTVSAFVDNVPFILLMLPVLKQLTLEIGTNTELMAFALLVGACLGGNITPSGATANIVACGLLARKGYPVSFSTYVPIGLKFTAVVLVPASTFLWIIWS